MKRIPSLDVLFGTYHCHEPDEPDGRGVEEPEIAVPR